MIGVIDYGASNIYNLMNALKYIGAKFKSIKVPEELAGAEKIIFPGVGSFQQAATKMTEMGLVDQLKKRISAGAPFLGICLGFQLLFEESKESKKSKGLAVLKGKLLKFTGVKAPQIGWNKVSYEIGMKLFDGLKQGSYFYFVHSYALPANNRPDCLIGTASYGIPFVSAVQKENIYGVQFHPERSGAKGLKLLENFIKKG